MKPPNKFVVFAAGVGFAAIDPRKLDGLAPNGVDAPIGFDAPIGWDDFIGTDAPIGWPANRFWLDSDDVNVLKSAKGSWLVLRFPEKKT